MCKEIRKKMIVRLQSGSILGSTCQRQTQHVLSNLRWYPIEGLLHLPPRISTVLQSDYPCHGRNNFRHSKEWNFVFRVRRHWHLNRV